MAEEEHLQRPKDSVDAWRQRLEKIMPYIVAASTVIGLILSLVNLFDKIKISWVPSRNTTITLLFALFFLIWILLSYRINKEQLRRDMIILSLFLMFISYLIYMASDIIYGLREDSVELSSKIEAAMVLMKDNRPKESIDVLSDIVADFKSKVPSIVYLLRGTAYYNLRECQTSLSDYRQSLSIRHTKEAEFNFASATLCLCGYKKANDLFEKYVNSYPEDMSGHYNFASTHQLLNNLDKATEEYNIVIRNQGSLLEESYFNIGVVYALYFAQSNKIQDVDNSISYLQASIDASIAESKKKKTRDKKAEVKRKCMIKNAMVPIREREPACAGWYRTDDLTSLVGQSTFKEWWSRIEKDMTAEELKCEG